MTVITTTAAIADPNLLGRAFAGESWSTWRAVLRAAEGLPLDDDQRRAFAAVAERDPPAKRVRELWVVAGRRSGKDLIASAIAAAAGMGDYRAHLRPGERATVMCLATDRSQARIVHRYIAGYFQAIPLLASVVARETDDGLELRTGVEIVISTNSFRAVRGRTVVCAIFDETAFWRDENSATPDFETYNAVVPSMITMPGAMLIGISTPYRRSGLLFDRWRRFYGGNDADVLVVKGASTTFNPTLPQSIINQALERDPEIAAAEWLAEWRSDLADFVAREVVDAAVVPGRYELSPVDGMRYAAFCDPSGGSSDSMTLAIGHTADGGGILDAVREVQPPFSPASVVAEFAALLGPYGIRTVSGDRYGGEWPAERFREHGIDYKPSEYPKSDLYREFLPLLNSVRCELLDNPRLVNQLVSLERRTARGGRDTIDHGPGAHDDLANSVAGVLVGLAGGPRFPGCGIFELYRRQAEALEDALYDSQALRGFAGIDLVVTAVPDATTVLNFRHWLEQHDLTRVLFDEVGAMLEERGLLMRQGTIVDATIIAAPPSTKNKSNARDPEMHQTKKGNQWHFGMKAHIGVDVASRAVHTVIGTAANEADINQAAALLHGQETDVFADAGYLTP